MPDWVFQPTSLLGFFPRTLPYSPALSLFLSYFPLSFAVLEKAFNVLFWLAQRVLSTWLSPLLLVLLFLLHLLLLFLFFLLLLALFPSFESLLSFIKFFARFSTVNLFDILHCGHSIRLWYPNFILPHSSLSLFASLFSLFVRVFRKCFFRFFSFIFRKLCGPTKLAVFISVELFFMQDTFGSPSLSFSLSLSRSAHLCLRSLNSAFASIFAARYILCLLFFFFCSGSSCVRNETHFYFIVILLL